MIRKFINIILIIIFFFSGKSSFSQDSTIIIKPEYIGVIYNKVSEKFYTDSLLKPGSYILNYDEGIFIINAKMQKTAGDLPITLKDSTDINFSFTVQYQLNKENIGRFVNVFRDNGKKYERTYLTPKIENLLYEHTLKYYDTNELNNDELILISKKIIRDFNENTELNQYFELYDLELRYD